MPSARDLIVATALGAGAEARRQLRERGREPDASAALILALEEGIAELLAAESDVVEWQPLRDERAWRRYVERVREALEADPPERQPPPPPRHSPPALLVDLVAGRGTQ